MAEQVVIADAGPLIALSRIGALDLLQRVFGDVLVTSTVRDEIGPLRAPAGVADEAPAFLGQASIARAVKQGWIRVIDIDMQGWRPVNPGVDPGEASAIHAAESLGGDTLLVIDDRAGRAEARAHGVRLIGTAAVVGMARLQGLIPQARPVLQSLVDAGYFIGPAVVAAVLADLGE